MRVSTALFVAGATASATAAGVYALVLRPWQRTWGVEPEETAAILPGDEQLEDPQAVSTRGITIHASPAAVWPWLVQMGYGRAGWYSYDALDMEGASADTIHPEWQSIAVGDMLRTHPEGGFEVTRLEPQRALVLMIDNRRAGMPERPVDAQADVPAGLRMSGAFLSTSMPGEFAATWAFVLRDLGDGRTRLVERFRFAGGTLGPGKRMMGWALDAGMFLMMRRQLLGIRGRVERATESASSVGGEPVTGQVGPTAAAGAG